jgi:hypothetical protein
MRLTAMSHTMPYAPTCLRELAAAGIVEVERLRGRDRGDPRVPLGGPQPGLGPHLVLSGQARLPPQGIGRVEHVHGYAGLVDVRTSR